MPHIIIAAILQYDRHRPMSACAVNKGIAHITPQHPVRRRCARLKPVHEVPAAHAAKALAGRIVANGPLAVAISKKVILESSDWSSDEMWAKQQEAREVEAHLQELGEEAIIPP